MLSSELYRAARCESSDVVTLVESLESPFFKKCKKIAARSPRSIETILRENAKGESKLEIACETLILGARDKSLLLKGAASIEKTEKLEAKRISATSLQRYTLVAASAILVPFILQATITTSQKLGAMLPKTSVMIYVMFQAILCSAAIEKPKLAPVILGIALTVYKLTEVII